MDIFAPLGPLLRMCKFIAIIAFVVASLLAPSNGAYAAVRTNGSVQAWTVRTNEAGHKSLFLNLATNGIAEITPFAPDVVRVRFHFLGTTNFADREEVSIAKPLAEWPSFLSTFTAVSPTNYLIQTDQLRIEVVFSNRFLVNFKDSAGRDLLRDRRLEWDSDYSMLGDTVGYAKNYPDGSVTNHPTGFKVRAVKEMPAGAGFFGLGDEAGPLNRRGRYFQFWTQDTYNFGEYLNPKYTAFPFWYGVQPATTSRAAFAYGIFFNNPARPVVDLSLTNGTYTFEAGDDQIDYFFFGGGSSNSMSAIIDRFSELTGRPMLLPKWGYGYQQSRHSYFTAVEVTNLISTFRRLDIPCDAVYLDIGHQKNDGQPHQLSFASGFSNPAALVSFAVSNGVQLIPIVEPLLTTNDPLHSVAASNLFFIKDRSLANHIGTNFLGGVSWLDWSIEATRGWWQGLLTNYLATNGFKGIWNDLTEPNENGLPLDTIWYLDGRYGGLYSTNDTRKWTALNRNTYNVWQGRVTRDALKVQNPSLRPFVLTRSGWPGVQQYAIGWSGDNGSSYDHLRYNSRLALSVMISGQAHFGNDIGGFVDDANGPLLTRWLQAGVLAPFYRNHQALGTTNQEPWAFGDAETAFNRHWIQFRYRIMPYLYSLAHNAATNGLPMNVPTAFFFTSDTNTWLQNEYDLMAGTHLLAAPVVESGATARSVYLPAGSVWFHWDTDQVYPGGLTATVPASLSHLPLFARAGAIIPMGPAMNYANEFQPHELDIHVWPGASNQFALIEDDGLTTNYLAGVVARTPLSVSGSATSLTFTIHPRSGSYNPGSRDFFVVAHAMSNVVEVKANGNALARRASRSDLTNYLGEGWAYDTATRIATIKIADSGTLRMLELTANGDFPLPSSFPSAYTSMAVAGLFNLWNEAAQNMRLVATSQWACVLPLKAASTFEFKFVANNSWSAANWGINTQTLFSVPLAQIGDTPNAPNIVISNLLAGAYTFRFNESTRVYRVDFASMVDSDGDGMDDAWELAYGLNPLASGDASSDLDGDWVANGSEYVAGTRPVDPEDYFALTAHAWDPTGGIRVTWNAVSGRYYQVFYSSNLPSTSAFSALPPFAGLTGSGPLTIVDTNGATYRAYQIRVSLTP